jgi:hypothetical protein
MRQTIAFSEELTSPPAGRAEGYQLVTISSAVCWINHLSSAPSIGSVLPRWSSHDRYQTLRLAGVLRRVRNTVMRECCPRIMILQDCNEDDIVLGTVCVCSSIRFVMHRSRSVRQLSDIGIATLHPSEALDYAMQDLRFTAQRTWYVLFRSSMNLRDNYWVCI